MWLYVTRSNNCPHNIATYYLDAVQHFGGCPQKLITDLGTENGIMASIQSFFRNDEDSHRLILEGAEVTGGLIFLKIWKNVGYLTRPVN